MCLLLCFFLFSVSPVPRQLETLEVGFHRITQEEGREDSTIGTVYYDARRGTSVSITHPLAQLLNFNQNTLTIYYPDERRAFRIAGRSPITLPFFEAFRGAMAEDHGLADIGYELHSHEIRVDTLFTHWEPPEVLDEVLGRFTLVYSRNRVIGSAMRDASQAIIARSSYGRHILFGSFYFPLEITTVRYHAADSTVDRTVFRDPSFNEALPEDVIDFNIPQDAAIEEIKW